MLAPSFPALPYQPHRLLILQLPQLFPNLIQRTRVQQQFRSFFGEDDPAHFVVTENDVNRLLGIKHFLQLTLKIGDGDEFGEHGWRGNDRNILYVICMENKYEYI